MRSSAAVRCRWRTIAPASDQPARPPGQPAGALRPAGLGRRLGAMVYDALLVVALWMFTLFPMVAVSNDVVYGPGVRSVLFLELYAFFAYFWVRRGQTLGMLAWRLEVHSRDGGPLTLTQATLRFFAAMVSLACLGLGYLWLLVDRERRTWPDLWSSSQIFHRPKPSPGP